MSTTFEPTLAHPLTMDVRAAADGDEGAFSRLVAQHANLVCSVVLSAIGDVQASEEVAQEVFLQAWRGIGKLRNPQSFRGWLRQLARNRAADHLRKHIRHRHLIEAATQEPSESTPGADEALAAHERAQALDEALETLPVDAREVLTLFYREGRSVKQVADLLDLQEPTVRKRLSRARALLREDVLQRLGEHLTQTAPGTAFLATVGAALATASPSTAMAASGGLGVAKVVGTGALLGTGFGLIGVWAGYQGVRHGARTPEERRQLRWFAGANALAVAIAGASFTLLEPIPGVLTGMIVLLGALWLNQRVWLPRILAPRYAAEIEEDPVEAPRRHRRQSAWSLVGLLGGSAGGLGGALGGLVASGHLDALTAALIVQALGFVGVPLLLAWIVPPVLGVPRSQVALGSVSWLLAAPFLMAVPWAAGQALGTSPLVGAIALSLTAGVVEESSRALLYRRISNRRPQSGWNLAVVLGIGHGGVEAVLFGLPALFGLLAVASGTPLPEGAVMEPWGHVLMGISRVALLLVHVGFTLLVWRAVKTWQNGGRGMPWFLFAVGLHIVLDLAAFALPIVWPAGGLMVAGGAIVAITVGAAAFLVTEGRNARWW
ncbi:MAG: YhfC family glutamic-type intramembrane protease [Myxococcota bacterium]